MMANLDKKIKAWFAILSDTEKNYTTLALMSPEGRTALRQMSAALRFLSLEEDTSLDALSQEISHLQKSGVPLSWVACQAIYSNQDWKVLALKKELGEHWNTWKKEALWPLGFKASENDNSFPEILPDFIMYESHALQSNPLMVSELFYFPALLKKALKDDFDPTLPLSRLKTLTHPAHWALGACLQNKDIAVDVLWKEGRVQTHQPSLAHALICISQNAIRNDDVWFPKLIDKIDEAHLFEPQKFVWLPSDRHAAENFSPLYYLLDGCSMKYPHRWEALKQLPFEKLPSSEVDSLLMGQIRTLLSFENGERLQRITEMSKTLFEATHPGENWTRFFLTQVAHLGSVRSFLDLSTFLIKNQLHSPLALSDVAIILKESDPFYKMAQRKDNQNKSERQMTELYREYVRRDRNGKLEDAFMWSPSQIHKWLPLVKKEDQPTLQRWSNILLEFSQDESQSLHQKMLNRIDFLSLQATLSTAQSSSKNTPRI